MESSEPSLKGFVDNLEPSDAVFYSVLVFIWVVYLWESYLDYRQRRIYKTVINVPKNIVGVMDETIFTKSRLYNLDGSNFGFWKGVYTQIETTILLTMGAIPWLWSKCVDHTVLLGYTPQHELLSSILFVVYTTLFTFVTSLPWNYYKTFVIEEKHGFNKQTFGFFVKDKIKQLVLSLVLMIPIIGGLIFVIRWGGHHFYVYAWFFTLLVTVFFMFVYPNWIAPLFDRYEPLPEGSLKTGIEKMASEIDFPLTKLFVVEGSKRSNHSNAYFYGFWKNKRIVLFDTLMEGFVFPSKDGNNSDKKDDVPEDSAEKPEVVDEKKVKGCKDPEVLAILGHELGHWKLNHINYNLLISNINIFLMFFLFGQLLDTEILFIGFGFPSMTAPLLIRLLVVFQFIFSPYNEVISFLMTLLSRCFEFQADRFAVDMNRGKELANGLVKLLSDNLSFPVNDWLYSSVNFSHPPLLERLAAIRAVTDKTK